MGPAGKAAIGGDKRIAETALRCDGSGDGVTEGALLDEPRIFMDGLSDEAGAAAARAGGLVAKQAEAQKQRERHTILKLGSSNLCKCHSSETGSSSRVRVESPAS